MEISATERETLRRYLLGQQPETDLSRIEEHLMTDSAFYEELLILEDEISDQYLRGEMSGADRLDFENHFLLAPERRGKVRFARALNSYVNLTLSAQQAPDPAIEDSSNSAVDAETTLRLDLAGHTRKEPPPSKTSKAGRKNRLFAFLPIQNPMIAYSLAATLLLVLAGISWMVVRSLTTTAGHGKVFAVSLAPGTLTRDGGGEIQSISIPAGTGTVHLQLLLAGNEYHFYQAILLDSGGRTITTSSNLTAEPANGNPAISLDIAPGLLPPGDYRVKLNGLIANANSESAASYLFRITSR